MNMKHILASVFLCLLPQLIITQDVNRRRGIGSNVEISSEDIIYYTEDDIQRLARQTTVVNNRPVTLVPFREPSNTQQNQQQNAIVYPEPSSNRFGQVQNGYQKPLIGFPLRNQNNPATIKPASSPLIKVPLNKIQGTGLARPLHNEVVAAPQGSQGGFGPRAPLVPQSPKDSQAAQNIQGHAGNQGNGGQQVVVTQPPVPLTIVFDSTSVAMTNFGLKLMQTAQQNKVQAGNIVVSPYSVATMLALLQQGAYDDTQRQISEALQMTPQTSLAVFKKYIDSLKKQASRNVLKVATNVYIAPSFSLNPAFKNTAIQNFGSDVTPLDFNRPEVAVQTINNWIASMTDQKITKLLTAESISENSQLVLANAVYFKGLWQTMFNPQATETKDFKLANGQRKLVPYMKMRRQFKSGTDFSINSQVIFLPFEGELYSLMIILPAENLKLDDVMQRLQGNQLLQGYHNLSAKEVQIEIPRFTIRADTDLNPVLRQMGVTNIFNQNSELFGIGNYRNYSALISSAKHTALLSIDEKGGSAAAATAFAVVALSYEDPSDYFRANRPFLAVLWNEELAAPMFMAKVEDPTM